MKKTLFNETENRIPDKTDNFINIKILIINIQRRSTKIFLF